MSESKQHFCMVFNSFQINDFLKKKDIVHLCLTNLWLQPKWHTFRMSCRYYLLSIYTINITSHQFRNFQFTKDVIHAQNDFSVLCVYIILKENKSSILMFLTTLI